MRRPHAPLLRGAGLRPVLRAGEPDVVLLPNPEHPEHWFYKEWILKAEERRALYLTHHWR